MAGQPSETVAEVANMLTKMSEVLRRVRATVAYHGAAFHGFAENPGVESVAGALRAVIEAVAGHPIELVGAGRTDAGVHAWAQVVSFDVPEGTDLGAIQRAVNARGRQALVMRSIERVAPDFSARFSALSRTYRYRVLNSAVPNPFLAATTWQVPGPLSLAALNNGCIALVGEHDYTSFCKRPKGKPEASLVRHVMRAEWFAVSDDVLEFEIEARAFCHNMVRSIVGTLVEVGLGRRTASYVHDLLAAKDRARAPKVAPPHGLTLWAVRY